MKTRKLTLVQSTLYFDFKFFSLKVTLRLNQILKHKMLIFNMEEITEDDTSQPSSKRSVLLFGVLIFSGF